MIEYAQAYGIALVVTGWYWWLYVQYYWKSID